MTVYCIQHSENETVRMLVRKHGGLPPLVRLIQNEDTLKDKELLRATTGAVWKLAYSVENVEIFDTLHTIPSLVNLLSKDDETVSYSFGLKVIHFNLAVINLR